MAEKGCSLVLKPAAISLDRTSAKRGGYEEGFADMGPNELMLWLSSKRQGSWSQFRSALESLNIEDERGREREVGLPLQHRLRINLECLAHVEFNENEDEYGWRVAPPVLAATRSLGQVKGILCGARSIAIINCLQAAAQTHGCEIIEVPECPDVVRLTAPDDTALEAIALAAKIRFQSDAAVNLLCNLSKIDHVAIGVETDMPFGRDVVTEFFSVGRRHCYWEELGQRDPRHSQDGLFRCTRWQSPEHFLRLQGRTFRASGQIGKYFVLQGRGRRVMRYDAQKEQLTVPAICRPPKLIDRALALCSGLPPTLNYGVGRGKRLMLTYSDIDASVAGLVAELLHQ